MYRLKQSQIGSLKSLITEAEYCDLLAVDQLKYERVLEDDSYGSTNSNDDDDNTTSNLASDIVETLVDLELGSDSSSSTSDDFGGFGGGDGGGGGADGNW